MEPVPTETQGIKAPASYSVPVVRNPGTCVPGTICAVPPNPRFTTLHQELGAVGGGWRRRISHQGVGDRRTQTG